MTESSSQRTERVIDQQPRLYRTKDVARILGISPSRVRRHVHAGLCQPRRSGHAFEYTFRDLVLLRSARGLLAAGVSTRRVHRALGKTLRALGDHPLSTLRFVAENGEILVREGDAAWEPESGQLLFAFRLDELARTGSRRSERVTQLSKRERHRRASEWFARGVTLESVDDNGAAAEAYRKALDFDERHGDAAINLGRLLQQEGRLREAARLYRAALAIDPADAIAHYNLALVMEDQHRPEIAVKHYRKALELVPDFADAHYNLARLFEDLGRHADAVRHFLIYSKIEET